MITSCQAHLEIEMEVLTISQTTVKAVFIHTETNLTLPLWRQTSHHSASLISCTEQPRLEPIHQVGGDSRDPGPPSCLERDRQAGSVCQALHGGICFLSASCSRASSSPHNATITLWLRCLSESQIYLIHSLKPQGLFELAQSVLVIGIRWLDEICRERELDCEMNEFDQ